MTQADGLGAPQPPESRDRPEGAAHRGPLIGCAGWGISAPSAAAFAGEGSHLERYARIMTATEINSSFYRPHKPQTYARWAGSVPDAFRFSLKLPKSITHEQRLLDVDDLLARFVQEAGMLGQKLGCILVQLPPGLTFDAGIAGGFFTRLAIAVAAFPACTFACEARHASWFSDDATALLRRHGVTRVIADPAVGQPGPHVATTSMVYMRLHGAPHRYYSAYGDACLARLHLEMRSYLDAGRTVWCIFDNTASGAALPNALALLRAMTA